MKTTRFSTTVLFSRSWIAFPLFCFLANGLWAQTNIEQAVSINSAGSAAHASALLDLSATDKGMLDLTNLYLNGGLALSFSQNIAYAQALNDAVGKVNAYWHDRSRVVVCNSQAGTPKASKRRVAHYLVWWQRVAQRPTSACRQTRLPTR